MCGWVCCRKNSNGEGLGQVSLRSHIPRPKKCNCMVAWDSIILKVRACTLASGKINGISRTICCTDSCQDHVDGVWCWTASVLRFRSCLVGCTPPGGHGRVTWCGRVRWRVCGGVWAVATGWRVSGGDLQMFRFICFYSSLYSRVFPRS